MTDVEYIRLSIGLANPNNPFYDLIDDSNIEFMLSRKGANLDNVFLKAANIVLMQLAMMPTREKNGDVEVWGDFAERYQEALEQAIRTNSRTVDLSGLTPYLAGMEKSRICDSLNDCKTSKSPLIKVDMPIEEGCGDSCDAGNKCC